MCKTSHCNYGAVFFDFFMCFYDNEVVNDILSIIFGGGKRYFLEDNCKTNSMK